MKNSLLLLVGLFFSSLVVTSQNMYNSINAASIQSEANTTDGWTGSANISTTLINPQNGTYALRVLSTSPGNGRDARFTFPAVIGTVYSITIWARQGSPSNQPAFANWTGFSGFTTRVINSTNWVDYNFLVTATATNPQMVVYASTSGSPAGMELFIDAISIIVQGSIFDTQAPTIPSNLTANNTTDNSTTLNWTASTDNIGVTGYTVRRNGQVIASLNGNSTTYIASGLNFNTPYSFSVVAIDAANNTSSASNVIQVTTLAQTLDTQAPSTPSDLTVSGTTSTSTILTWTASTDNVAVTSYTIIMNDQVLVTIPSTNTTYSVIGLAPTTTYNFNVEAADAVNNTSLLSNIVQVTTLPELIDIESPTVPSNLVATTTTSTTTNLSWNPSSDNVAVTNYLIMRDGQVIATIVSTTNTYTVTGLSSTVTYNFNVVATDAANNLSQISNTIQVTTMSGNDTESPSAPSNLVALNIGASTLTLSWDASTDNQGVMNYIIFTNNTISGQTGNATTTFIIENLIPGNTYTFHVVSQDAAGNNSDPSNTITNSSEQYTSLNSNLPTIDWQARNLYASQYMGIGTLPVPAFRLSVNGNIRAKEIIVESGWADFVFKPGYNLPSLSEVESQINEKGHLKDIPSALQVANEGISLGLMNTLLLQKIEEMTLYLINMDKKLSNLEAENKLLKDIMNAH